jgi:hypothetical protein
LSLTSFFLGSISQWGKVEKKHVKTKEAAPVSTETSTRGRGRGGFEGRGRGRGGPERAARGGRGARSTSAAQTNGTKTSTGDGGDTSVPAQASTETGAGWDAAPTTTNGDGAASGTDAWPNDTGKDALSSLQTDEAKPASAAAPSTAKAGGWAGLFAKSTPPPAPKKAAPPPSPAAHHEKPAVEAESILEQPTETAVPPPIEPVEFEDGPSELPSAPHSDGGRDLTPSKDALTEHNLEKLPDTSHPPESATAASTVASTLDPLAAADSQKTPRPPMSGYHATALKATGGAASRSASFARKVMDQQEAVVMPQHHQVDKAAVQFGKMGLSADDGDVDDDREEPETRTQLPDDSPAAPRASLPPALPGAQESTEQDVQGLAEAPATAQRQSAGLPPAPQQAHEPSPQSASAYADQYRYGQATQKYDPFGQQPSSHAQPQEPFSNQVPQQPSAAPNQQDYSAYYNQQREAYNQYYGGYGHAQEGQRSGSAFGTSGPDSQSLYATSRPQQVMGQQESAGSGHNTPAPGMTGQQQHSSQHAQQSQGQQYPAGYGYQNAATYQQYAAQYGQNYMNNPNHRYGANRPMFDDVRRQQENDYYQGQYYNQYGGNTYKSNMYGQGQQGYGYEHSASPANAYSREGAYGRTGSAQPVEGQQSSAGSTGYSGMPDPFGRSTSGFGQAPGLGQQHAGHAEDPAKPSGPSPSMQGGRPGSAVNSGFPTQQGGLPPPSQHSAQQAFGGYPNYGAGLGSGHQSGHQTGGYGGNYGSNAGFGGYSGAYGGGRGGWNNNGAYGQNH